MKKIVLLSDTHNTLDKRFTKYFKRADEIWHAGDIGNFSIIDELNKYSEVRAVSGNIDGNKLKTTFKDIICFNCEEVKVLMTHVGGYPNKYNHKIIPIIEKYKPNLFISGHSHILKVMYDKKYNMLHMNPGAIGEYGQHKVKTILIFNIENKNIKDLKVIEFKR